MSRLWTSFTVILICSLSLPLEALCVCAAILDAVPRLLPDQRLAVHTDNINTCEDRG